MERSVSRRGFLRASAGGLAFGAMPMLLSACAAPPAPVAPTTAPPTPTSAPPKPTVQVSAPTSPPAPQPAPTTKPAAAGRPDPYPRYIPFTGGPKPDFHDDNPLYADGFDNYPATPFKANQTAPGTGSTVNMLVAAYFPPPTPFEQNPTWQAVNKQLNADVRMNIVPGSDYRTKFATTIASEDLPDVMHLYRAYALAPSLPQFFKAKCADLTPYLSGDAAKDYPYLAAIPPLAWKNSAAAHDGQLFLVPVHRPMYSVAERYPYGGNLFKNIDIYDKEIGQDYVPKDADDFMRVLKALNRPQENRYAIGKTGEAGTVFGLGTYAEMFGAPNQWKVEGGKLIRDRETDEYKAAVGFLRDVMSAGLYPPDAATATNTRNDFVAKKFALSPESFGNSWIDFWQRGLQQNPQTHFAMVPLFSATAGQKPVYFLSSGYNSMNVLKNAPPDRIREVLRIMNWLASPFGSEEQLLLYYGLEGQDYRKDDKGNPVPTTEGTSRAGYVPWRYIGQHPFVYYQAELPGFAKASYEAEHAVYPFGIPDPTDGYYAPTFYGRGATAETAFYDGVREIVLGRKPMNEYDALVREWNSTAGDQVKREYMDAMAAA